jgi:undecaprenyl-phosphate galactose phosphotransferase
VSQVQEISKKSGVQDIAIALPDIAQNKLRELVEMCEAGASTIRVVPKIGSLFALGVEIESFGDVLSLSVARNLVKPWNLFLKRSLELICTLLLFVIFLPLLFIIGLAIIIDTPGPLIFVHERLGRKNRTFRFLKFRSMYVDGDLKLNQFLKENSLAKEEWKKYRKIKQNDPRVTRVGKFIRKYSLDELPQLINVIKGDMNLVGPRPYMPREKKDIGKSYPIISRVRPGITGLWQVRGRNILPFEERLLLDEYYIRNWSLWLDIVILFKTLKVFFTREGAY